MKIGILSDTHNNQINIHNALAIFSRYQPALLIYCGDATTLESIQSFCEYPIIYTFGNGDLATGEIAATLKAYNQENYAGFLFNGEFSGKKIAVIHGHLIDQLDEMINNGQNDYVFTGHTHKRMDERVGKTRLINPGAVGGSGGESRSIAILDLDTDELVFEIIE
ncbi:MAG: metallophosphoesterase family protein [Anaerolineaceae bacterium]|nr:metallophosphoesterase family protein [Anaerolineaceae bacterium]